MRGNKLGNAANVLCGYVVSIIFLVLVSTSGNLTDQSKLVLNIIIMFGLVALFVSTITREMNPHIFPVAIICIYTLMCFFAIIINSSNNMMFPFMMLSLGGISLFKSRRMLVAYYTLEVLVATVSVPALNLFTVRYDNVFNPRDFTINLIILTAEFIAYNVSLNAYLERENIELESANTVQELIKVIGAKREDAIKANRSKSDFLANMSHEIRTPINAVLGFNEMILRETKEPVVTEYAKDIRSSGTSLLSLVNEILDFSKIEAGKMELLPVEYDLDKLFNDLLNIIGLRAQEKGLTLKIQADPSLPRILYGDEVRLKQIISNLLTNGVKYTDKGYVSLIVDYKQIDDYQIELIVKVEDTGKGIRPEDMEKLFTPFERLEEMSNRHVEGTGLGIALTRTFLQMMGSNLEVESIYGYGSTFSFRIRQEVESWDPIGSLDEAIERAKSEIESSKEFFVAPLARVLVVDDIPVNLKVIAALLKRTRIEIDTAGSGMEALTLMRKNKYDMIFMDHMMPEMDGIETLERMNADRFDVNRFETPVIALTANAVSGAREMYVKKGFADYMTKPVDSAHLEAILLKYLKPELIVKVDGSEIDESFEDEYSTESKNISALRHLPMINVEHGIETSGGAEIYEDVIRDYMMTIDEYSKRIEDYYNAGDIDNFRIQVHALKSTSRMAGADEVSELAKELELAANDGNIEYIKKETPVLLARYRDLKGALTEVFKEPGADDTDKPEMDEDTFVDALHAILEGVEIFDYDLIESVMAEIENCRIPDQYKSAYDRMKMLVADVNTDELGECIKTTLRQNGKA